MYRYKGFTLIELIATIVLMAIISIIVGQVLLNGYQNFITSQNISQTDWRGLLALERLANDIHTIRSAGDISTITSTQLAFTDVNGTAIQFQLSGSNLLRNSQLLASGVQSFNFSYLDKNGATTAAPSSVRFISISLALVENNFTQSFSTLIATRGMQ